MIPTQLINEVEALRQEGLHLTLTDADGMANIRIAAHPIPCPPFSKPVTELLLRLPLSYPNGKPDMFWTDEDLVFKDGKVPSGADSIEAHLGKRWRRFSWHLKAWNPGIDNLRTYIEFVNSRFARKE
jgi:Prokaryotic E2 family E